MDLPLDELDATAVLAATQQAVTGRRLAEVRDLELLAQWAAIHSGDPTEEMEPDQARAERRRGNVLRDVGGEGTPRVQDFCLGEIALARSSSVMVTINALADVLDLQHRLPHVWAVVRSGAAEVWLARKVARMSRHLPLEDVSVVDVSIAAIIAAEAPGRVLSVAEGKIIEANPELHDSRVAAEQQRRYVRYGRRDEHGLQTVIARVQAGDAQWIKATLERVVEILTPQYPGLAADEVRSIAFGMLARPAELLTLLLENLEDDADGSEEPEPAPVPNRAIAMPADLLESLRAAGWVKKLAPKAVLYLHLHEAALRARAGVVRAEELGALSMTQLRMLLNNRNVVIKPVIDLRDRIRSTSYEHPEALKERVHLITGGDYWPFASSTGRNVDLDHATPYDPHGPPGQTSITNSGPLGRTHHRWKTHAGFSSRQSGLGRYAWMSPHGLGFLVDHEGTHRISAEDARLIIGAPPGLDIYPI